MRVPKLRRIVLALSVPMLLLLAASPVNGTGIFSWSPPFPPPPASILATKTAAHGSGCGYNHIGTAAGFNYLTGSPYMQISSQSGPTILNCAGAAHYDMWLDAGIQLAPFTCSAPACVPGPHLVVTNWSASFSLTTLVSCGGLTLTGSAYAQVSFVTTIWKSFGVPYTLSVSIVDAFVSTPNCGAGSASGSSSSYSFTPNLVAGGIYYFVVYAEAYTSTDWAGGGTNLTFASASVNLGSGTATVNSITVY